MTSFALIYSQQYRKPCVVASPTDAADDVIAACRAGGAIVFISTATRRPNADTIDSREDPYLVVKSEEFVVQLRDDVGPERWTEAALRRSLGRGI